MDLQDSGAKHAESELGDRILAYAESELGDRILAWLGSEIPGATELALAGLTQLTGGNARSAWALDVTWRADGVRQKRECVLLIQAEAGQLERDLALEFATLRSLEKEDIPSPSAYWCDATGEALGSAGFVMERIAGATKLGSLLDLAHGERNRALALGLATSAAALHRVDWQARGLRVFGAPAPDEVARNEIAYWEALFLAHRMEPLPPLAAAFRWLYDHAPVAPKVSIVHGDLRFGNFVYEGPTLRALLDWEMAHLGDPCEDLAWAYRSLWGPAPFLSFDQFLACYRDAGGVPFPEENLLFYRLFGEMKHAVISLTGAHAFANGGTDNLRLADRMTWVPECLQQFFEWVPAAPSTTT